MSLAALRSEKTIGKTLTLAGPKAWTVQEVIELCEKLANAEADVTQVPVWLLKATRSFLRSFQWARDAADRLVRQACSNNFCLHIPECLPEVARVGQLHELHRILAVRINTRVSLTPKSRCLYYISRQMAVVSAGFCRYLGYK